VGDAVEPRPQVDRPAVGAHRPIRVQERLLHDVLRPRPRQEPAAVAQERTAVAVDDRLERPVVAGARQVDEPLVVLRAEHRTAREPSGLDQVARRHACLDLRASVAVIPATLRVIRQRGGKGSVSR
jgi:hypothetical protein